LSARKNTTTRAEEKALEQDKHEILASSLLTTMVSRSHQKNSSSSWRQLFNGRDLDDWEHVGAGRIIVENGLLRTDGHMGLLWYSREKFGDCIIRVVYKTTSVDSNSGVFIRIADRPKDEIYAIHHGYEVQIGDHPDNDEYHRTGAIYSLAKSNRLASKPSGAWNTMEITLDGARVFVKLNGMAVTAFDPQQPVPERRHD
jgi:Domain of Unknown Function (DUF1080)